MSEVPRVEALTLVVPCYNEATRLDTSALTEFARVQPGVRFLLVDDGSTDATGEVIEGLAGRMPESFQALRLGQNRGKAEAVRRGLLTALGASPRFVGFWDADLATPLAALPEFYEVLVDRPEIDLVMGARVRLLGRDIDRHAMRHYIGRGFATAVSLMLRLPVYDTQCGAKLFRVNEQLSQILAEPFRTRWVFDVEILARMGRSRRDGSVALERSVCEMPLLRWHDVPGSKLRSRDFARAFLDLARIYLWLHTPTRSPRTSLDASGRRATPVAAGAAGAGPGAATEPVPAATGAAEPEEPGGSPGGAG